MPEHKLSLRSAILIILNVMVGFGIFVNTTQLAHIAGFLGFACYLLVAALMVPLISCMAIIMGRHTGGFYVYGAKEIHPFAGFLSAWIFFTGKLASAALIIHVVVQLLQGLIPLLATISTLSIDCFIICLFGLLNLMHMRVGTSFAAGFFTLKMLPLLFAILVGLYLFSSAVVTPHVCIWAGITQGIPFVVYAFTGFETACSLSRSIEDDQRNGPRAIFWAFTIAVTINVLYQLLFFAATSGQLMEKASYLDAFPTLLAHLLPASPAVAQHITNILHLALAIAALGGSYGILFSNHWNLHVLAEHGHLPARKWFTFTNRYGIPVFGIFAEVLICIAYLFFTQGHQKPLQQINALACTIAYTISVLALFAAIYRKEVTTSLWLVLAALASCGIFLFTSMQSFWIYGTGALIAYSGVVGFGLLLYLLTKSSQQTLQLQN